ncbi:MAG TPA: NAD(P)-dependent glycerol-3-phosphate dehydrogenase [Verrucomicrobiales bacterium]|nr:NAD(P)-dependent glycerol-3-phosphate dehydrogenase [Verrucomicrobiales bacterium]HIL71386.1 NAD(P)-dependent glycerol-3-phosphate dehydrogenase [Verrucomicrobiota bacterium]
MKVAVLGVGSWGSALGRILLLNQHRVTFWGRDGELLQRIRETGSNDRYLPDVILPGEWSVEEDLEKVLKGQDALLLAVSSAGFRGIASRLPGFKRPVISVTKGIEASTGLTMCGILRELNPELMVTTLSGPTFATEVSRDMPTAAVAAGDDPAATAMVQRLFHRPTFRVYTSDDLIGVELGGALKNVIAIAAGVGDGLGFGDNSKAALVTRGIAEIRRLSLAAGAKAETMSGLSGLGDLIATCFSALSRNRGFGEKLGRGSELQSLICQENKTVEGYPTALSAHQLSLRYKVETPIIDEIYAMLYRSKDVRKTVNDLLTRESKPEID